MNKKILLGVAISIASLQAAAVPFAPTDARAMAMGGTGVASAKTVHAIQFNPSLLSSADESDDFGVLLSGGGYVADEDEFVDSADDFVEADHVTGFETAIDGISAPLDQIQLELANIDSNSGVDADGNPTGLTALQSATSALSTQTGLLTTGTADLSTANQALGDGLRTLSNKALRGGLGFGAAIAIPSKKFSVAVSVSNSTTFSGVLRIADKDINTLTAYTSGLDAYANVLAVYAAASDKVAVTLVDIETLGNSSSPQDNVDALTLAFGDVVGDPTNEIKTDGQLEQDNIALAAASDNLDNFSYGGTGQPASEGDVAIFENGALASGADEVTLESEAHIIAVAVTDVALTISREFDFSGTPVAIGISPKLQRLDVYDYIVSVEDEVETDNIDDFGVDDTGFNLDIGTSMQFGEEKQGKVGIIFKNLISNELTSVNGQVVEIQPQVRAGVAYQAFGWINLAADLDLTENEPLAFEDASQFLGLGLELDIFGFMQGRAGYRTNLASTGQEVVSVGFGLSPFSLFHMDLGVYTNTSDIKKEVGAVFELGVDW